MSELIIRPGHNDHRVLANLLAAAHGVRQLRPLIAGIVLDAQVAAAQPEFGRIAQASGTSLLIDPLTFLLQSEVDSRDRWAQLPFARAVALGPSDLNDPATQHDLTELTVDFQLKQGATAVIAPYVLVDDNPAWLELAISLLCRCREHLDANDIRVPLIAVIALAKPSRMGTVSWAARLDRLSAAAAEVKADRVALAVSGTGGPNDGAASVRTVIGALSQLAERGLPMIAWRQGLLGPAAVAAGAHGYECGIGLRERCDLAGIQASRRPRHGRRPFAPAAGIFMQPLGWSLQRPVARQLLADRQLQPRLVCDDERCCPQGTETTLADPRRHAIVARSTALRRLDRLPSRAWKLNDVARSAANGAVIADLASRVLAAAHSKRRVPATTLNALADVTDSMRDNGQVA
jgi:hypothetical protein